jgi:DNA polymerase-3 subunit epsilon
VDGLERSRASSVLGSRQRDQEGRGDTFAVLDVETTGLRPQGHDRIVEIAVVRMDESHRSIDEWVTLVNPQRDLGPTSIHGITGRDVANAPTFVEIAGDALQRLADAVVVGHNVAFDLGFLRAEVARLGYELPPVEGLCTLGLSCSVGFYSAGSLDSCCQEAGVAHEAKHSALGDARATAALLRLYLEHAHRTGQVIAIPPPIPAALLPKLPPSGRVHTRASEPPAPSRSLAAVLCRVPATAAAIDADQGAVLAYTDLLGRVIEDRRITPDEIEALAQLALSWNLTRQTITEIHRSYLTSLVAIALADDVLTDAERVDLQSVASLLDLQDVLAELLQAAGPTLRAALTTLERRTEFAGKSVCFTGESVCSVGGKRLDRAAQEFLAASARLVIAAQVTKKLDLLVLADPDSLSSKARKAAAYGVRRVAERAFWPAIGVCID